MSDAQYGCRRRLAPFQGTLQVVSLADARAISADGKRWQLELRAELQRQGRFWGSGEPVPSGPRFLAYGTWTAAGGIARPPVNVIIGDLSAHPALPALITALERQPPLPFPPIDRFELWSLADDDTPLALVASALGGQGRDVLRTQWIAAPYDDDSFHSPTLDAHPPPGHNPAFPLRHATELENRVRVALGRSRAAWFERHADGSRSTLQGARTLPASAFPACLLREDWPDAVTTGMVRDYLEWQAPVLLTLHELATEQRARLERLAMKQALRLQRYHRLYPDIIDRQGLNTALVEAAVRSANDAGSQRA